MIVINFIQRWLGYKTYEIIISWSRRVKNGKTYNKTVLVNARSEGRAIERANGLYLYPDEGTLQIQSINGIKTDGEMMKNEQSDD